MPRFILTSLGVLALLLCAPHEAGAAERVRVGIAPSGMSLQVEVPAPGAAPREHSWADIASGPHLGISLHARGDGAWLAPALDASLTASPEEGRADHTRALPDARAPPA